MLKGMKEYAQKFHETEAARTKIIEQGRRAYRLGIDSVNNPLKFEHGERRLWELGWTKERDNFQQMLKRNGVNGITTRLWMAN